VINLQKGQICMDENDDKNILKIVIKKQLIIINPFENV
jgi:hypothetical protein